MLPTSTAEGICLRPSRMTMACTLVTAASSDSTDTSPTRQVCVLPTLSCTM